LFLPKQSNPTNNKMKAAYIALFFAALTTATLCADAFAGSSGGFYVRTSPDPASCSLQITYTTAADRVTIGQQYKTATVQPPSDLPAGCSAQNLSFKSFFLGDVPMDTIVAPTFNNDTYPVYNAVLNSSWLAMNNGTGCVYTPQTTKAGLDQYLCRFNYSGTALYFVVWGMSNMTNGMNNFTINTSDASTQAFVLAKFNYQILGASTLVVRYNNSFPNITAKLYNACGSNSSTVSSLTNLVTVTSATDLSAYLGGMWLGYTLVKRNNATAPGDYLSIPSNSKAALFTPGSGNGCWTLGISYSDILPNLSYCAGGCKITFVLRDSDFNVHILSTDGVTTTDGTVGGGNNGNNGTNGTGSGNGNGNGNGNNGGNGGNGGAANSASSMIFNACLLLISVAYLAWF